MTGGFDGARFGPQWQRCTASDGLTPACRIEAQLDEFAKAMASNSTSAAAAQAGVAVGALERALLFEYEREVARVAALAQDGGFEQLFPATSDTMRATAGYLALLEGPEVQSTDHHDGKMDAEVVAAAHALRQLGVLGAADELQLTLVLPQHVRPAEATDVRVAVAPAPERPFVHQRAERVERRREPRLGGVAGILGVAVGLTLAVRLYKKVRER